MARRNPLSGSPIVLEQLEDRCLLAAPQWGLYPRIIDQDVAQLAYPDITGAGEAIAVLDTGIDASHPAVAGKVVAGYDFIANKNIIPVDTTGHGTGTSTIAAGLGYTFNGQHYSGVAPGANLIALRIDNGDGAPTDANIEKALQWVVSHRAQYNIVAVNISEGGDIIYNSKTAVGQYADELQQLADAGVFVAASAGNDGVTNPLGVEYPAADPNVCAVGGTTDQDAIWSETTRGPDCDLVAPGLQVPTAYLSGSDQPIYLPADGTSFSSPFAAGAAALIKQINPNFTPAQITSILHDSGRDVFDPASGLTFKRLDLSEAMLLAYSRAGNPRALTFGHGTDSDVISDAANRLYIAYYDASQGNVRYLTRSPGGAWSATTLVDDSFDVGHYVSIALNSSLLPGLAYYDATNGDLRFARYDGSAWHVSVVDSFRTVGLYPSLAFDSASRPGITYYDKTHGVLKFAAWSGTKWNISNVDTGGDVGRFSSIAIDPGNGRWATAYAATSAHQFRFAELGRSGWGITNVDTTRGDGGYVSLGFDKFSQAGFSYYDAYNADLKFAHLIGGTWRVQTVAAKNSVGLYSNLMFDTDGSAWITYYNKSTNAIGLAFGDINKWQYGTPLTNGGRYLSSWLAPNQFIMNLFQGLGSDDLHVFEF